MRQNREGRGAGKGSVFGRRQVAVNEPFCVGVATGQSDA